MTKAEAIKLRNGDEVFWTDPEGTNSRYFNIQTIVIILAENFTDYIACILDKDGTGIECFIEELS